MVSPLAHLRTRGNVTFGPCFVRVEKVSEYCTGRQELGLLTLSFCLCCLQLSCPVESLVFHCDLRWQHTSTCEDMFFLCPTEMNIFSQCRSWWADASFSMHLCEGLLWIDCCCPHFLLLLRDDKTMHHAESPFGALWINKSQTEFKLQTSIYGRGIRSGTSVLT